MTQTSIQNILTKAEGKRVALFRSNPKSNCIVTRAIGEHCFDSSKLSYTISNNILNLFHANEKSFQLDISSLLWATIKPKRGRASCNTAKFAISNEEYVLTFA